MDTWACSYQDCLHAIGKGCGVRATQEACDAMHHRLQRPGLVAGDDRTASSHRLQGYNAKVLPGRRVDDCCTSCQQCRPLRGREGWQESNLRGMQTCDTNRGSFAGSLRRTRRCKVGGGEKSDPAGCQHPEQGFGNSSIEGLIGTAKAALLMQHTSAERAKVLQ